MRTEDGQPTDRMITERIITEIYARFGKPAPRLLWFAGPLSCILAYNFIRHMDGKHHSRRVLGNAVREQLTELLGRSVEENRTETQLERLIRSPYWNPHWSKQWTELRSQVQRLLGTPVSMPDDAPRLEFPSGFWSLGTQGAKRESSPSRRPDEWDSLQHSCWVWFPFENAVLCSEAELLHGVAVRPIEDREPTPPPITAARPPVVEPSQPWFSVSDVDDMETRVIDVDPDPQIGTLLDLYESPFDWTRLLRVRCATGREFIITVPSEMTTARQANAWTYGLEADEYQLEVRS